MIALHKKYATTLAQLSRRDLNTILVDVENAKRLEGAIEGFGLSGLDELNDELWDRFNEEASNHTYVKHCRIVLENAAAAAAQLEAELLRQNIGVQPVICSSSPNYGDII